MEEHIQRLIESQIRQEAHMETIAKASDRIALVTEQMKAEHSGIRESVSNINDRMHLLRDACHVKNVEREKKFWMFLTIAFGAIIIVLFAVLGIKLDILNFVGDIGKLFS